MSRPIYDNINDSQKSVDEITIDEFWKDKTIVHPAKEIGIAIFKKIVAMVNDSQEEDWRLYQSIPAQILGLVLACSLDNDEQLEEALEGYADVARKVYHVMKVNAK